MRVEIDPLTVSLFFAEFPTELGFPYRVLVRNMGEVVSKISRNYGKTPLFVRAYRKSVLDRVFFDIDYEGDLEFAYRVAKKIADASENLGLTPIMVFSGKKGFHIYSLSIPESYSPLSRSILREVSAKIMRSLEQNEKPAVDPHVIGDLARLTRIPNLPRPDSNFYPVYIPQGVWESWKIEDIKRFAKLPHPEVNYQINPSRKLSDLVDVEALKSKTFDVGDLTIEEVSMIEKGVRPCLLRAIKLPEPPHAVRVAFVADCKMLGVEKEVVKKYLKRLEWSDYDEKITNYQVDHIYSHINNPYTCKRLRELKICDMSCLEGGE